MSGPTFCAYIDDSHDHESGTFVISAVCVPIDTWRECHDILKAYRSRLREEYGIYVRKEFHAHKFVSGRGRLVADPRHVPKALRAELFRRTLQVATTLPGLQVLNAVMPWRSRGIAFERLLNRLNVMASKKGGRFILFCDAGNERIYTRMARKMRVFNPIHSSQGQWRETGQSWKNIPLDRLFEDPVFRDSSESYFVQLADFVAFALLRQEHPTPNISRYGLESAFDILQPVLNRSASRSDRRGILRL